MTARALPVPAATRRRPGGWLMALLVLLTLAMCGANLLTWLPWQAWPRLADFQQQDLALLIVQQSWLPRLCVSLLCGALLGLAGILFQQVLRNPLAEPMTLGVSAGAQLALALGAVLFPTAAAALGNTGLALLGAGIAALVVFGIAWRRALDAVAVAVAGLVVSLYCGAIGVALQLFHAPYLRALFLWGGGVLAQQDWHDSAPLALWLAIGILGAICLRRPLALFALDDTQVRSLGVPVRRIRLLTLLLAVALAAAVVAHVGVIGFVGLAAPALAGLCGARRLGARMAGSVGAGALLLCLTDQVVQRFTGGLGDLIPAGAATALAGAPVMLLLLARLPHRLESTTHAALAVVQVSASAWRTRLSLVAVLLVLACATALLLAHAPDGWRIDSLTAFSRVAPWRVPRMLVALAGGAMLAVAGTMMQCMTGNPMASPDLSGVSAGAALGLLLCLLGWPEASHAGRVLACVLGAALALAVVAGLARRARFEPTRVVLIGVALGALSQALLGVAIAGGGERATGLLAWLGGSTYAVSATDATVAVAGAVLLCALLPLVVRWLVVLPLGASTTRALGVHPARARAGLLLLIAAMTGMATLACGPLSFIGLTMPHCARMLGARRVAAQLLLAALLGALTMVLADWLGRSLWLPRELPAGLVATALCAPYLLWLLARGAQR